MVDPVSLALEASALATVAEGGGIGLGSLTTLGAVSTFGSAALVGGALVGGGLLLNALTEKKHVDNQITVKQATPPRIRGYGRALLGGTYFLFMTAGSTLVSGFVLCEGPIDAIEEHWFNGQISPDRSTLVGHANLWPWGQQVAFNSQLGTADQTTNPMLAYLFGGWDASHRLRGLAVTAMICILPSNPQKNFQKFFPSGVPNYLARCRLSPVYDPRDAAQIWAESSTWRWSANPALCVLDYLTSARGMNVPRSRIDLASFAAMADLCDQPVALGPAGQSQYAAGTPTEARYTLWGTYSLDEEPREVLARMLKTCDGEIYPTSAGRVGMRGGRWTVPTVTITPDVILSCDLTRGVDKLAKFNQLRIRTISLLQQFQLVEGDPWDDVAAQQASGEVVPEDLELAMVPSYTQGQRLAKIVMHKSNPDWLLTMTTTLAGLQALGERTVHVTYPSFGIDGDFFVNAFEIVDEATCKLSVGSLSADAYAWSTSEEGNPATSASPIQPTQYVPPAPTGLAVVVAAVQLTTTTSVPTLKVSVTKPDDTTLSLVAQYRLSGSADAWRDMVPDNDAYTAQSGAVSANASYDVQVALSSFGGSLSAFVTGTIAVGRSSIGPVAAAFASGISVDMGMISQAVTIADDFGLIGETVAISADLGRLAA